MDRALLVAVALGVLQGVLEWLPVSSEGAVAVARTATGAGPETAVSLSLFLHAGTGVAAAVYYRSDLRGALSAVRGWRPRSAFAGRRRADLTYLVVATLVSGVVGVAALAVLERVVTGLTGGLFLALVGALLVGTGLLQRVAGVGVVTGDGPPGDRAGADAAGESGDADDGDGPATDGGVGTATTAGTASPGDDRAGDGDAADAGGSGRPDLRDALLVGALQGLALLPGVSRSGTTASALLLRGHDGPAALRLSFLLSVPASFGATGLAVAASGGLPGVAPGPAAAALAVAGVVGYLTVGALTRLARRLAFWAVCVAFGALGVLGGALAAL